jgi:hypothetical protein
METSKSPRYGLSRQNKPVCSNNVGEKVFSH